jgi:hypothetical protein
MKKALIICALAGLSCVSTLSAQGQTPNAAPTQGAQVSANATTDPAITPTRVFGEVTAIDPASKQLTIRTKAGNVLTVQLSEQTVYQRMPVGVTALDKAVKIALTDIALGDQVYARGRVAEDRRSVPAQSIVALSKADITEKQERERADWQRRSIAGTIAALNPATKEVTVQARLGEGSRPVIVEAAGERVQFLRYAPDSVKFSDAKPSSFAELKVGDQIRVLGERNATGARFIPEKVMSGSFRTIGGTITNVNPQAGEIQISDIQTRQPLTIRIGEDSLLRRISPEVSALLNRMIKAGAASASSGGQTPQGGGAQTSTGAGAASSAKGGDGIEELMASMPAISLGELKPGAMLLVSSTASTDPSKVKAIIVISGVEPLFASLQSGTQGRRNIPNLGSMSMGVQ